MFRLVLEDLSDTPIHDEKARLTLLAFLDQTPVDYQAEVGDRLLEVRQTLRPRDSRPAFKPRSRCLKPKSTHLRNQSPEVFKTEIAQIPTILGDLKSC
jgi:hypothetical protein